MPSLESNGKPATVEQMQAIIENLRAQLTARDAEVDRLRELDRNRVWHEIGIGDVHTYSFSGEEPEWWEVAALLDTGGGVERRLCAVVVDIDRVAMGNNGGTILVQFEFHRIILLSFDIPTEMAYEAADDCADRRSCSMIVEGYQPSLSAK